MERGIVGCQLQRALKIFLGGIEVGSLQIGGSKISNVFSITGTNFDRLVEFADGVAGISALHVGQAEIVVHVGIVRRLLQGLLKRRNRNRHIPGTLRHDSKPQLNLGRSGCRSAACL